MSKMGVAERIWSVEYSDERLWKLAARPEGLGEEREVAAEVAKRHDEDVHSEDLDNDEDADGCRWAEPR